MKKRQLKQLAVVCLATTLAFNPINASAALLKRGTRNSEVRTVQVTLKQLGYYNYPKATGYYGRVTETAVKKFQRENGLIADGVVGRQTISALSKYTPKVESATLINKTSSSKKGALDWFSKVKYIWTRGTDATVIDVETGKSFRVRRTFGTNHADIEPLTMTDANTIKNIWNGWSWERRAVVVEIGDYVIAASMTAMPHAGLDSAPSSTWINNRSYNYGWGYNLDSVKNNGVDGHMDIHFFNSRTHGTNVVQKSHQDMIMKANKYINDNGY